MFPFLLVETAVQHIHMCVWPHLLNVLIEEGRGRDQGKEKRGRGGGGDVQPEREEADSTVAAVEKRKAVTKELPRIEISVEVNNVSFAVLAKPSNLTSHGVCMEVATAFFLS